MSTGYKVYAIAYVAEDKEFDSYHINAYPIEILPTVNGDVTNVDNIKTMTNDIHQQSISISANKTNLITAEWMPTNGSNRLTPPDVCKGEMVLIYTFYEGDRYYWLDLGTNPDLRKKERALYFFSNKNSIDSSDNFINKGYSLLIDTYNKLVRLFTSNNDGEATTYEITLDTKLGQFFIEDGLKNNIILKSTKGRLEITTTDAVHINSPHFAVNNGGDELIKILLDLIKVNMSESHIGNLGKPTSLTPGSKSAYNGIYNRLSKFIDSNG